MLATDVEVLAGAVALDEVELNASDELLVGGVLLAVGSVCAWDGVSAVTATEALGVVALLCVASVSELLVLVLLGALLEDADESVLATAWPLGGVVP